MLNFVLKKIHQYQLIIRYLISGGIAAFTDLGLLYVFTSIAGIWYMYSASMAFLIAFFISFFLQKFWTFKDCGREGMHKQMILYFIVGVVNLEINAGGMYILVDKIGIMYMIAQIVMGGLIAIGSFLLYNFIIFRNNPCKLNRNTEKAPDNTGDGLKILITTGVFPPDIGGPATYSKLLAEELPKKGFAVKVLSFGEVRKLPKIIRHLVFFGKVFKRCARADLIYAQDTTSVGLPSLFASMILRKKLAIRIAGDHAWEQARQRFGVKDTIDDFQEKKYGFRVEFMKFIQRFTVKRADLIITPSEYFKKIIFKWIKGANRIHVVYNGIRIERPQISEKKEKILVSVGRLVPWKGFSFLIGLMKDLPEWKLAIIGEGPERQNLENKIKDLELSNAVQLTGALLREELLNYLKKADIFILNTSFESFSFQVLEAMNAKAPVIAANIGSLPELIEDNREGILVKPNDREGILNAIDKIDKDQNFKKRIIGNAYNKSQKFSIENTVNNLVEIIEKICSRK